ncbi:MAG: endonuclease III domain-containing protein, partial [Campylobacterales bacterium]|nr:endonuclease III domain-containing protein [Campylobacterales bacterium]
MSNQIYKIYRVLYKSYGSQGWWPIQSYQKDNGYHKNDFTFPRDDAEVFEVCIGSILTQNTAFNSVVETLKNLTRLHLINAKNILAVDIDILKEAIRPSGYYNQKASYIINFTKFFISLEGNTPTRDELLNIKGIGEETADSILLYGYKQTQMKVDAY